jgi:hypothetical protein
MIKNLNDLTEFISRFAKFHPAIQHITEKPHFVELLNDGLTLKLKNAVYAPFIAMQRLTVEYANNPDNLRKILNLRLFFLNHIQDAGNFRSVLEVKNQMEGVAEDFLKSLFANKKTLKYSISNATLDYIEETNLCGVILELSLNIPFNQCDKDKIFVF